MTARRRSTILALCVLAVLAAPALAQPKKKPPPPAPPPAPVAENPNADIAYGAFQRGEYLTALAEATKRAQQNDPKAMTLVGLIYAQGIGVPEDDIMVEVFRGYRG